ncbi:hypothetical protein KY312_01735 [Candidatus Woesearchaeota archaeon]|nr:hypothetical protein [Candidatus Woesearchaeota archaeon]
MKKAFLKTAEVMIAIVVAATFLIYIFPSSPVRQQQEPVSILETLEDNDEFRQLLMLNNSRCIDADAEIRKHLPARFKYSYEFNILDISDIDKVPDLPPDKTVYVETLLVAGNNSQYEPKVLKLYYWDR